MSGILNLSRNLGLITGASLMGAVFAWAAGTSDLAAAGAPAIAHGARTTFGVAGGLAAVGVVMGVSARFRPKAEATRRGTAPLPRGMSYD
jgi:phosphate/sulfate permease